jgi:Cof subfamily protein (haloacid dehalogenase superfamily)
VCKTRTDRAGTEVAAKAVDMAAELAAEGVGRADVTETRRRPRLVATDLDGTIVGPSGEISDRTVRALHGVEALGVPVVFVTGRPHRWLRDIAERTGRTGLAICANGGTVYDLHTEQVVAHHPFAQEVGLEVSRRLRDALPEVAFAVETLDGYAREQSYRARWEVGMEDTIGPIEEIFTDATVKLLVRHESMDADRLLAAAREIVGELAEFTHSSIGGLLEVSAAGVSKATTLAGLCADRGIAADDVIAFGDMPNDLAMLAWAGTAYAVAGAHPEVLAAVEMRTGDPVDDGVAQVLERVFDLPGP